MLDRVVCSTCGKLIPTTGTVCPHCGADKTADVQRHRESIAHGVSEAKRVAKGLAAGAAEKIKSAMNDPRLAEEAKKTASEGIRFAAWTFGILVVIVVVIIVAVAAMTH